MWPRRALTWPSRGLPLPPGGRRPHCLDGSGDRGTSAELGFARPGEPQPHGSQAATCGCRAWWPMAAGARELLSVRGSPGSGLTVHLPGPPARPLRRSSLLRLPAASQEPSSLRLTSQRHWPGGLRAEADFLTVLGAGSPRLRCSQGWSLVTPLFLAFPRPPCRCVPMWPVLGARRGRAAGTSSSSGTR